MTTIPHVGPDEFVDSTWGNQVADAVNAVAAAVLIPGPKGDTGATGPKGDTGDPGTTGSVGPQGPPGADSTVVGPMGPPGPQGFVGAQGLPGTNGTNGADSTVPGPPGHSQMAMSIPGVLSVGSGVMPFVVAYACTIGAVRAAVGTAPLNASIIFDVNKNGVTIFTTQANRPTIVSGSKASTTAAPQVTALAPGDVLTVDVDQTGTSTPGSNASITLELV